MSLELVLVVGGLFVSIALLVGWGLATVLGRQAPERRRLHEMAAAGAGGGSIGLAPEAMRLTEQVDPRLQKLANSLPKSPKEMSLLRRRLATAGIHSFGAAVFYAFAEITLPFLFAIGPLWYMTPPMAYVMAAVAALVGYMTPGLILARLINKQKVRIENGLADALDLMIVCVEAGTGLDQAIQKTSIELEISHPELAEQLRLVTTEIRAGKSRIEAFKNFASRTKVEDVRALVAMLIQTDKFGTSIAQALRTHAETSRTKRRQRAEERAAKIGVKLVFPLVFFLFPAFYVVTLGPAIIQFARVFFGPTGVVGGS
jgi:tight adherence protein C